MNGRPWRGARERGPQGVFRPVAAREEPGAAQRALQLRPHPGRAARPV